MKIKYLFVKSELGAGTRGASLGIDALHVASYKYQADYFQAISAIEIPTKNELLFEKSPEDCNAHYSKGILEVLKNVAQNTQNTVLSKDFPLVLAGDHSSAYGSIAGIKMAYPEKRLGVIWVDAHADLHSPFTSPSGNMHGMPLAMALGIDNQEQEKNPDRKGKKPPNKNEIQDWENIKNIGNISPKIQAEDLVFIAVRDTEAPEDFLMEKHQMKNFTVKELRSLGIKKLAQETLNRLENCDLIYISFDVDSLDSNISKGTGTPVKNGLSQMEANNLLCELLQSPKIACLEMVEINPCLDNKKNKMAETAFEILMNLATIIKQK